MNPYGIYYILNGIVMVTNYQNSINIPFKKIIFKTSRLRKLNETDFIHNDNLQIKKETKLYYLLTTRKEAIQQM